VKTWHAEHAAVAAVLGVVLFVTGAPPVELVGSAAVLAGFGHASVSARMSEAQKAMPAPSVECWRKATHYWIAKELLWVAYFVMHQSYAALVGCAVFLAYPLWRRWWRAQ
jgi:hypothetical protein